MGLKATAAAGAAAAFKAAGDAKVLVSIKLGPTDGELDADTDTVTTVWEQESSNIEAVAYSDKEERMVTNRDSATTRSFLILGTDITAGRPNQTGEITDENSIKWDIKRVESDPTKAIWTFHCVA